MRQALLGFLALAATAMAANAPAQQGRIERLPEAPAPARSALSDADLVRLSKEIADPVVWAERVFAAGRGVLKPARVISLHRQGVPAAHLDALFERDARAAEADCGERIAERERQLAQRHDDELRRLESMRPICPPPPFYPYSYPFYPYPGQHWR